MTIGEIIFKFPNNIKIIIRKLEKQERKNEFPNNIKIIIRKLEKQERKHIKDCMNLYLKGRKH